MEVVREYPADERTAAARTGLVGPAGVPGGVARMSNGLGLCRRQLGQQWSFGEEEMPSNVLEVLVSSLKDDSLSRSMLRVVSNEGRVSRCRIMSTRVAKRESSLLTVYMTSIIPVNSSEKEVTMEHSVLIESDLPTSWEIPLLNVELAPTSSKTRDPSLETWLPKDHSVRTELKLASGSSRKRIRSPSSPSYPDATTFSDGEPAASESPELNPKDLTASVTPSNRVAVK
nr:hypothetical protein [Tanacetum cinerariifolium]